MMIVTWMENFGMFKVYAPPLPTSTSESSKSAALAGSSEASRAKADIPMTRHDVCD